MAEDYHRRIVDVHAGRSTAQVILPVLPRVTMAGRPAQPELAVSVVDASVVEGD